MRLMDIDKFEQWYANRCIENGDEIPPKDIYEKLFIEKEHPILAIPIEWILNKYRGKWEKAEMERRDFQFIEVIDELLADWEKENQSLE